jgi:diguanylate cyclase (GGDEF)-like protein
MKIEDQELLSRLRALGSKARGTAPTVVAASGAADEAVGLLGLPEQELTPTVRSALGHLIAEVAELRRELATTHRRVAELERLADEDALAPISNRRAFLRSLARTISYVGRYGAACSLLYFDVDGLKSINDTHGHAAGDAALVHVAGVLRANVRTSDVVGRLGGDEFGVLLTRANGTESTGKAQQLADRIARMPLVWQRKRITLTVAYGAHGLSTNEDPQQALAAADRAMYAHKQGRAGPRASPP